MKKIYSDDALANVENFQNILKLNGIQSSIRHELLNVGIGGMGCSPELWVSDKDVERALKIIENMGLQPEESKSAWVCPHCGEDVDGEFSECWNCSKPRK